MADLLIENGLVVDGSGSAGFRAAVVVEGDTLAIHRGDTSGIDAARVIDASGHVVCPGFVDLHSHAGLTILGEPHHDPKVRQGVTTELVGIDGISHAPFKTRDELHRYIWLDSGLNGYPPMPADWLTVAELLSKYDGSVAVNVAYILGNSPVRIWSVGWYDRSATDVELEDMKAVAREAMEEGGVGAVHRPRLRAGRLRGHRRARGALGDRRRPGRLLPHAHPVGPAREGAAGAVGGGGGDRPSQRHPRSPDALPARQAGPGQPSGLSRPGGRREGRRTGRHVRLLLVPVFRHDAGHRLPGVDEGRRPGATSGCPEGPARSRPHHEGAAASGAGE